MQFTVQTTPTSDADIEVQFRRLEALAREGEIGSDYPERWYEEVEAALLSLEEMPDRHPPAPEAEAFHRPLRHLLRPSGYRIIFEVRGPTVYVLHIRHQRQQWVTPTT